MNPARDLMEALVRRWWLAVVVVVIAVASAACFTARQQRAYEASSLMVVLPSRSLESDSEFIRGLDALDGRTVLATFAKLASTSSIRQVAADALGFESLELKRYSIRGKVLPNRNMISVDVRGPDPEHAATLANAVASVTRDEAERLYRVYELEVVERAEPVRGAVYPNPLRNYMVSGVLGCFVGLFAAVIFDRARRRPIDPA